MKKILMISSLCMLFFLFILVGCNTQKISFTEDSIEIKEFETYTFEVKEEVTYEVEDDKLLLLKDNTITGLKTGTTNVVIMLKDSPDVTKKVKVVIIEGESYSITYDLDGGTCDDLVTTIKEFQKVTLPTPQKDRCNFLGWYEGETKVIEVSNKNYVLKASWEQYEYIITYDLNGGTCDDLVTSFDKDEKVELPIPVRNGYEFIGWYESSGKVDELENKDYTIKAAWKELVYIVNFYDDENNLLSTTNYKYGETIIVPDNFDKVDTDEYLYEFVSWDKEFSIVTENLDIHGIYESTKLHLVSFYNNDILVESQRIPDGETISELVIDDLEPKKFRYLVNGYFVDKDLTKSFNTTTKIYDNKDLYITINYFPKSLSCDSMKISILGDSISTFYSKDSEINSYYSGQDEFYFPLYSSSVKSYKKTWWGLTLEKTGTRIAINNSWSGSNCYNWGNESNSGAMNMTRINTLGENGTPHIIIVFIGTNDNVNGIEELTFKSAYNTMLQRINNKYPNAYVFCITLGYSAYSGYYYTDATRLAYNEAIKEVSKKNNCLVCDLAAVQTKDTYLNYLGDFLHPNADGMVAIANLVSNKILNFFANGEEYNK